jgi:hypothetical protein
MYASAKVGETLAPQVIALAKLGLSDTEIKQVLADDKRIDKGEKLFELSAEGKEAEKKYKNCGVRTVKSPYGQKVQKEKKVDAEKTAIIEALCFAISPFADNTIQVINAEREIEFTHKEKKYRIVLSAPRK